MKKKLLAAIFFLALSAFGNISSEESRGAIYEADPDHLWNRIHLTLFERPDSRLAVSDVDAVDPPLWPNSSHLKSGTGYREAVALLDEFLSEEELAISDPLKRAVLQHDLWSVFDWSATCYSTDPATDRNLEELRLRLSNAIAKLALNSEEIAALPNNLAAAAAGGAFAEEFDLENPKTPFLPHDLFDPKGSWVCVRGAIEGPSAPVHTEYYNGRSPFLVFVKLPGGRKATASYLSELNEATTHVIKHGDTELPQFPVGTAVALLRQMTVIDTAGKIRVTPLTQTLQMRVYREVGKEVTNHKKSQEPIKFRLGRARLFAGENGGLELISWTAPLRVSLLNHDDVYERRDPLGNGQIKTVMESCVACHSCGGATPHGIFTYKQDDWVPGAYSIAPKSLRLRATDGESELKRTVEWKMKRNEWRLLKGLLPGNSTPPLRHRASPRLEGVQGEEGAR
jgi:hypothetical protein